MLCHVWKKGNYNSTPITMYLNDEITTKGDKIPTLKEENSKKPFIETYMNFMI